MTNPSFTFLVFALAAALLVNLSQRRPWREGVMLVANLAFLASFCPTLASVLPFAVYLMGGYGLVEAARRGGKLWMVLAIGMTLAAFSVLKRYAFVPQGLTLASPYVAVGVSYITFRILHLVIDTGQGLNPGRMPLLEYVNYTLNFPCLVAGPIQTLTDYREGQTGRPDAPRVGRGLERIVQGFFKVFVVSTLVGGMHDEATARVLGGAGGALSTAVVIGLYPFNLYYNFSGYTDVALGVGGLLGMRLPENFDHPFSAASFIDFWNRWHMSLSAWLRTYVFTPFVMSAMRVFPGRAIGGALSVAGFFMTFFLVGAWHGQTSEFLVFGLLQGGGVALNKVYQLVLEGAVGRKSYRRLGENPIYRALSRGLTFTWFAFTLLWFWARWALLSRLYERAGAFTMLESLALIWLVAALGLQTRYRAREWVTGSRRLTAFFVNPYARASMAAAMTFGVVLMTFFILAPPPPIIYKAF